MPLLQGQPFKLIEPPGSYPDGTEIYTIQHTGEKFLSKSDYEDRLALYSQSIWTCQCTGHTNLTHQEAWTSEAKVRVAAKNAVPLALQKPLLGLVHHSLSPLEQLIDAASVLCHSQFHVGEELMLIFPKQTLARVVKSKECPKICNETIEKTSPPSVANGTSPEGKEKIPVLNGTANGVTKGDSPGTSPGKENLAKEYQTVKEENSNKKEMLPKLYDVLLLEEKKLIENVPSKNLQRPYKIPSKDQLRLFIRSCALRHRGTTCTPWVVSDELIKKFSIPNKLPSMFLSSPKPNQPPSKRKAQSLAGEVAKRAKSDKIKDKKQKVTTVSPLTIKSDNCKVYSVFRGQTEAPNNSKLLLNVFHHNSSTKNGGVGNSSSPVKEGLKSSPPLSSVTKHPLSLGKPKIFPRPTSCSLSQPKPSLIAGSAPRKRGRPPLSKEEKERNKKLRQLTLLELSKKNESSKNEKMVKIKTSPEIPPSCVAPTYLQVNTPFMTSPYRAPVKRANSPEAIMRLPFMRRFIHEHKTLKGVLGQFRRLAFTMDLVLSKLSPAQIEMIPDATLKQDLLARQKKVQDKKFFANMTPEEKKQYMKDRARTVALERWRERKMKNLKIEDKTVPDLLALPEPTLVSTPKPIPNSMFGDVVMITEFIRCFREFLSGEEKFRITTTQVMEAITAGSQGYKVIADIVCYLLSTIIHDDISKNYKELGVSISGIPVNYQTAPELIRLALRKQDEDESASQVSEEYYQIGKEKNELSDELFGKLEKCEFWELSCHEIVAILKALIHKVLGTASLSVYVEEVEEKVLQTLRERRKYMKQIQKEKNAEQKKKREERMQNKIAKVTLPKKQRGRPKGYSPKLALLQEFLKPEKKEEPEVNCVSKAVFTRRKSCETAKKEKAEMKIMEKERQKQLEEDQKRQSMDRKYDDIVSKRDNLLRRTPIGYDRYHNRYWIFHATTPGLYVEKGWVDENTDYRYSLIKNFSPVKTTPNSKIKSEPVEMKTPIKSEPVTINGEEQSESWLGVEEDERPLSILMANENEEDEKPLIVLKTKLESENDEDRQPLATIKSKLTISPMKMTCRGKPPKEAYILVDEDTQTFPTIGENIWYHYQNMEEVKNLLASLTDQGHRESQLRAAITINKEKLQYHFNKKWESLKLNQDSVNRMKDSLKEDIIQIEKELIEGWLGGVPSFEDWEAKAKEANDVSALGACLIEAQRHIQLKNLKSFMTPSKKQVASGVGSDPAVEFEEDEGPSVQKWREAVESCQTYSRLHVLVGLFDSCIKWEKSMATRKCKVCRSKQKEAPLVMCDKCETNFHWYCLRPPLREEPVEPWTCPACAPKKTRREEAHLNEEEEEANEQDEKEDPSFSIGYQKRRKSKPLQTKHEQKKPEKECRICTGRLGLIICSKCSSAYHSECHDPPLLSRARKDWVCGRCLNPKKYKSKKVYVDDGEEEIKPRYRQSIFNNAEEILSKRAPRKPLPRGKHGRFLCATEAAVSELDNRSGKDVKKIQKDKYGRSVREAKTKAFENMTGEGDDGGRRSSSRNKSRKNYNESDEKDDEENGSEDEESASESEECSDKSEAEDEKDEEGESGVESDESTSKADDEDAKDIEQIEMEVEEVNDVENESDSDTEKSDDADQENEEEDESDDNAEKSGSEDESETDDNAEKTESEDESESESDNQENARTSKVEDNDDKNSSEDEKENNCESSENEESGSDEDSDKSESEKEKDDNEDWSD